MAFYDHSLKAVKTGRQLLHQLGIPAIRPSDYFCEHVKTDTHMGRVSHMYFLISVVVSKQLICRSRIN